MKRVTSMEWERTTWLEEHEAGESISEIARRHQISRKALYKWIERYEEKGLEGLVDRSRAPKKHPNQVDAIWHERVSAARQLHRQWGPRKLYPWLEEKYGASQLPSESTIGRLLQELGLNRRRRPTPRSKATGPLWPADQPNEVWAVDFKGWRRTGDGKRCEPLTMTDQATRYLLCCQILPSIRTELVRPVMERVFREHGLPQRMRSDNGAPFASNGGCGLTELAAWWIELGIECERIEPGCPQQNGRHERMHRTLQEATMQPPAATLRRQQARFDAFVHEYNHERPHEALGLAPPARFYSRAARDYPNRTPEPEYGRDWQVRKVDDGGHARFSDRLFVSHALTGKYIGFEPAEAGLWRVWFYRHWLGMWEPRIRRLWRPGDWKKKQRRSELTKGNSV